MLAYSICHGGPAPHFFSDRFYQVLTSGMDNFTPKMEDLDDDMVATLTKVPPFS